MFDLLIERFLISLWILLLVKELREVFFLFVEDCLDDVNFI